MIDIQTETLIDPNTTAAHPAFRNPRTGRPCHLAQVYRFFKIGSRSVKGDLVRLEYVKVPGGLRTSNEAIARFIEALTDEDRPAPPIATRARQQQRSRAERELEEAGFEVGAVGV